MCLVECILLLSGSLFATGHYRKSRSYVSLLNSVTGFCPDPRLSLAAVFTRSFLRDYEVHLCHRGCHPNTISFYMGVLRSIYDEAVSAGYLPFTPNLFVDVFTGTVPTVKRAVAPQVIARILTADLSGVPRLEPCRDYLLLSLHLQGMSFIDLAHLRKCDIQGGVISYRRRKTGTLVQVPLLPEAQAILDKYANRVEDSPYLLSLVTLTGADGYRQYQSALHRQNAHLKEFAAYLGIKENLTTYTSRHTWATVAYHNGTEVGVVSQGMGHGAEGTTRIYLSSFAHDRLLVANYVVLGAILRPVLEGEIKDVSLEVMAKVKQQAAATAEFLSGNRARYFVTQMDVLEGRGLNIGSYGKGAKWKRSRAGSSYGRGSD